MICHQMRNKLQENMNKSLVETQNRAKRDSTPSSLQGLVHSYHSKSCITFELSHLRDLSQYISTPICTVIGVQGEHTRCFSWPYTYTNDSQTGKGKGHKAPGKDRFLRQMVPSFPSSQDLSSLKAP